MQRGSSGQLSVELTSRRNCSLLAYSRPESWNDPQYRLKERTIEAIEEVTGSLLAEVPHNDYVLEVRWKEHFERG